MAYSFDTYRVDIANRPFVRSDGYTTPQTATISLFNAKGNKINTFHLAYPDISDIYEKIGKDEPVNLDHCYLRGFSFTACKRYLLIDKLLYIKVNAFSARNAFFESPLSLEFSLVEFMDEVSFDESYFVAHSLEFHSSKFSNHGFSLTNAFIKAGRINFSQTAFTGGLISFKNTILDTGEKNFQDVDFGDGNISFINTDFGDGDVSFINTRFNSSDVSFKVARFGKGKTDFHFAKFGSGTVSFERVEFGHGRVDFRTVEFGSGKTSFNRAVFSDGEVNFEGAEASLGKLTFKRATFDNTPVIFDLYQGADSELIFERSTFPSDTSFKGVQLKNLSLEGCQFNSTLNLHVDICENINIADCIFRDIVEFYTHGEHPRVKVLNMPGIRLLGQFYINWEDNDLKKLIYNQQETTMQDKADQFRILKENFNTLGKYNEEDKAYVEFKRCELKADLQSTVKKGFFRKITGYIGYSLKLVLFDYMGLYATAPQRVIASIAVIYTLYSMAYALIIFSGAGNIVSSFPSGNSLSIMAKGFYFSVVTFFTIGYGDFAPDGVARVVAGTEGFMGVFLMSYFTVAFVRKILR